MTDFSPHGTDLFGRPVQDDHGSKLGDDFLVPPFSVLDARQGWWQERKRAWLAYGIKSEMGRAQGSAPGGSGMPGDHIGPDGKFDRTDLRAKIRAGETASLKGGLVYGLTFGPYDGRDASQIQSGTSIFDPVLCELAYRWFCPPGGQVVDPFAGGSVRGIVAHLLGYRYWGCDLSGEQLAANREQAAQITPGNDPVWCRGDARMLLKDAPCADFILSCPPYGDLERYSEDPADISTLEYPAFLAAMGDIMGKAVARLLPDRFACFVVGDFRDGKGLSRGFPADMVALGRACGLSLYNEAVLVTIFGSLPIRTGRQFRTTRKLGKTHQNVLVFVKGDPRRAAKAAIGEPDDNGVSGNLPGLEG